MRSALSALVAIAVAAPAFGAIYEDVTQLKSLNYDYVIVGGGTAGLVVASRLSEISSVKVLVLEAGISDASQLSLEIPLLAPSTAPDTSFDWNYTTVPQAGYYNRSIPYARGFVLGGSSSINYLVYNRGSRDDFDNMAKVTGDQGWSWNAMIPFMAANERFNYPNASSPVQYLPSAHSPIGALDVSLGTYIYPTDNLVMKTTQQLPEFSFQIDQNAGNTTGISWALASIGKGSRASSSTAYIYPIINSRSNLDILLHARATQVVKTGTSGGLPVFGAVKFVFGPSGKTYQATARKEVVLSAGTFNTPQLLMLSGIGAKAELAAAKIPMIVDLPSVGKNMSDHVLLGNPFTAMNLSDWIGEHLAPDHVNQDIATWLATKGGPLAGGTSNEIGYLRLPSSDATLKKYGDPSTGLTSGHYEMTFTSIFLDPTDPSTLDRPFLSIGTNLVSPTSRGTVSLNNNSPLSAPLINPNFLTTETDIHILKYAVQAAKRFVTAPAWNGFIGQPYGAFANTTTDAALEAYIRQNSATVWHASGTAGMSATNAPYGVLNPDLRVKNTVGLRVVDASALVRVPSVHPQGFIYIFAERAAAIIAYEGGYLNALKAPAAPPAP